jgi:ring-1,2-phenylacetyl-CoA epoxidase subunit PaaE
MDTNYALEQEEVDAGYILTCQSHPRTDKIVIDFDIK